MVNLCKGLVVVVDRFRYEIIDKHGSWDYGVDFDDKLDQDDISLLPVELFKRYDKNKKEYEEIQNELIKYCKKDIKWSDYVKD